MKSFLTALGITVVLLAAAIWLATPLSGSQGNASFIWETLVFLTLLTTALFAFVRRAGSETFTQYYLLSMLLKLVLGGAFIFVVIYHDRPNATPNAIGFLVIYVVLTVLEIVFLYRKTR